MKFGVPEIAAGIRMAKAAEGGGRSAERRASGDRPSLGAWAPRRPKEKVQAPSRKEGGEVRGRYVGPGSKYVVLRGSACSLSRTIFGPGRSSTGHLLTNPSFFHFSFSLDVF